MSTDIAYLIYLLLFLAVMAGSYLASNTSGKLKSFQEGSIWFLIFFGFIAIYGMRDDISNELFPTETKTETVVQQYGSYVFQRDDDGHFYALLTINDQPVRLVVDTGATSIVLNKADAMRIGIDPNKLDYSQLAYTANGTVGSAPVILNNVRIGSTVHETMRAHVNGGELHSSLLGMEYINQFSEFKIVKDLLYITP